MRAALVIFLAGAILIGLHFAVRAQQVNCDEHWRLIKYLSDQYDEHPYITGAMANGNLLQITVSSKPPQTWTVILVRPDGIACLVTAGDGWQEAKGNPL